MGDNNKPFLLNFKSEIPLVEEDDHEWGRTKRYPTSVYTAPRRLKSGYTRSGKWKPSKMTKGRTDKRAGR
tara:strand:+ start:466 stop:675 length:210 start_codon:yes stop_codon:yes gene_type:complete